MSSRQLQIARLVAEGYSDEEIRLALGISIRTVRTHLDRIGEKLNAREQPISRRRVIRAWFKSNVRDAGPPTQFSGDQNEPVAPAEALSAGLHQSAGQVGDDSNFRRIACELTDSALGVRDEIVERVGDVPKMGDRHEHVERQR